MWLVIQFRLHDTWIWYNIHRERERHTIYIYTYTFVHICMCVCSFTGDWCLDAFETIYMCAGLGVPCAVMRGGQPFQGWGFPQRPAPVFQDGNGMDLSEPVHGRGTTIYRASKSARSRLAKLIRCTTFHWWTLRWGPENAREIGEAWLCSSSWKQQKDTNSNAGPNVCWRLHACFSATTGKPRQA